MQSISRYDLITVETVTAKGDKKAYNFALDAFVAKTLQKTVIAPANEVKKVLQEINALKKHKVRKNDDQLMLTNTSTGKCCTSEYIKDLLVMQEQSKEKEAQKEAQKEANQEKRSERRLECCRPRTQRTQ